MDEPRRVVIVAFPGVQPLDVIGPAEVFRTAATLEPGSYSVEVVAAESGPVPSTSVGLVADRAFRACRGAIDTLIVAGRARVARRGPGSRNRLAGSGRPRPGRAGCARCAPARSCSPRPACSTAAAPPPTGRAATASRSAIRTSPSSATRSSCATATSTPPPASPPAWTSRSRSSRRTSAATTALEVARWLVLFVKRPGRPVAVQRPARRPDRRARAAARAAGVDRREPRRRPLRAGARRRART